MCYGAMITLRSGIIIKGDILEQNDDHLKINIDGEIVIKYYYDEIKNIWINMPTTEKEFATKRYQIIEFYDSGPIKSHQSFVSAVLDGVSKEYYPNGVLKFEKEYRNGLLNGTGKEYDDEGRLISEKVYQDDKIISSKN